MAQQILGAINLSTGLTSLTSIDGESVFNDDVCLVTTSDGFYVYQLESPNTSTVDSPKIIQPTSNGTTKRWILRSIKYLNDNVEFDKDKYLKIREIKEKDTDGIIFTLTDGTEIIRIDSTGLVINENLTLVNDNLNVSTLNNISLSEFIKSDGSVNFTNQIKAPNPISDDDLTNKLWVQTQITSAISPVDLSDYIKFNNTIPYSPSGSYHPASVKYVNDTVVLSGGFMNKSVYDTNDDGIIDVAATITSQGSLATLSTITSGYINSESATKGQSLIADGSSGAKWGAASSKIEIRPSDMLLDDTYIDVDYSSMWSMTNTVSFGTTSNGAIWINFIIPDGFSISSDILIDIFYTLSGVDNTKTISLKTDVWSTSTNSTPTSGTNEGSYSDTITSSTTNTDKLTKLTLTNGKIPNSAIGSTDDLITLKLTRLDTDTYTGTFELISVIFYQA